MRSPAPRPAHRSFVDPSGNILRSKVHTIRTNIFRFFFSLVFGSFPFVIRFFFYSPFQFLLILLFSSLLILRLLILLLLYFKLFVVLQT